MSDNMRLSLETNTDQAAAISAGLDAYTRLCIGQIEELGHLVRSGDIPMYSAEQGADRQVASVDICDQIDDLLGQIKRLLGYERGQSLGVGNRHVSLAARRSWEAKKVIDQVVANLRDPAPTFRGVNYEGLTLRYTQDPAPVVRIVRDAEPSMI